MKSVFFIGCGLFFACVGTVLAQEDFIDCVEDKLVFGANHDRVRARLSGTLDIEGYDFQEPAPGLIYSDGDRLFNPRLSLFLDAQLGRDFYVFAQSRVDRGFDPGDERLEARMDEYAIRYSVAGGAWLNLEVGKFATVVGNWVERHGSWNNPFITAPLVYENLTGVWDSAAAGSVETLLRWAHVRPSGLSVGDKEDKERRLPVIWGPSYGSGVAIAGRIERFQYAVELKNAALASRPESWNVTKTQWRQPTLSGRIGFRPNEAWNLGLSVSSGSFLKPSAANTVAPGHGLGDYREIVLGQDVGFAWHHFQLWTEIYWARFQIPNVGDADTVSYYVEAKYKFTARFFAALRWNQQSFGSLSDSLGRSVRWGSDTWRVDFGPVYRFTPHMQLKFQYSLQHTANTTRTLSNLFAIQSTLRF